MKRLILPLLSLFLLAAAPVRTATPTLSLMVDRGVPLTLSGVASSVFIANPDIADVQVLSPTQVMLFGKRTGETSFIATDDKGVVLAERTLVVSQDLSGLREELNADIPGNNIKAKAVPGGIVLTGTAHDPVSVADAYKIAMRYIPTGGDIINRVSVTGSNQIQIRVRFAEVQRSADNAFGFNWQSLIKAGTNMSVGLATGSTIGSGTGIASIRPSNASNSTPNDVLGFSATGGIMNVDSVIDALEQDGLLTILAEPNLTAMSGETANFLAGGQFPIPIPQSNGTISIQFQSYGISLAFTPTVLSGDRISLHVRPEVSELTTVGAVVQSDGISVPALTTRKAETTVEVASGESFAIAGLMDNEQTQSVNKFPMLGDLPVLGALFRSDEFVKGQTELVVIITPYIVKPSKQQLALPTDGFAPPTEKERLVGLRYSSGDPDARPVSGTPVGVKKTPTPPPAAPAATTEAPAAAAPAPAPVAPVVTSAPAASAPTSAVTAPVAAPPAPVAKTPVQEKAEKAPPAASAKPATQAPASLAPAAQTQSKVLPASPPVVPSSARPLVLHAPGDGDDHGGGLLVE
jgi:pilus assembly protein CpaC